MSPLMAAEVPLDQLAVRLGAAIQSGSRLAALTARSRSDGELALVALVAQMERGELELWESALGPGRTEYPALTPDVPQAHWFERQIFDFFGIVPNGHPRFKSLLLHEPWPANFHPHRDATDDPPDGGLPRREYSFLTVKGDGVFEIPVGPIHAGIIEPGHFRFSCVGEVIQNLEIRLGYVHRGVEHRMTEMPWRRARFLAEAASTDSCVAGALAHARAIEQITETDPPPAAIHLRALALEIERAACHIGDLGGVCSDIGFAAGAAVYGRLRGATLGLGDRLTGSRLQTAYVLPGGVASRPTPADLEAMLLAVRGLQTACCRAEPLLLDNAGALERLERTGCVRRSLARDFGLVGPAARASGLECDVRAAFGEEPYRELGWKPVPESGGDAAARVRVRCAEIRESLALIIKVLEGLPEGEVLGIKLPAKLPGDRAGAGLVEAWRGELVHLIFTDREGGIGRYCIKDPSFHNWTGLAIAARGELVPDFPLCNKSFGLSYSGCDL